MNKSTNYVPVNTGQLLKSVSGRHDSIGEQMSIKSVLNFSSMIFNLKVLKYLTQLLEAFVVNWLAPNNSALPYLETTCYVGSCGVLCVPHGGCVTESSSLNLPEYAVKKTLCKADIRTGLFKSSAPESSSL